MMKGPPRLVRDPAGPLSFQPQDTGKPENNERHLALGLNSGKGMCNQREKNGNKGRKVLRSIFQDWRDIWACKDGREKGRGHGNLASDFNLLPINLK